METQEQVDLKDKGSLLSLRVLEFFSGIGGMRIGLKIAADQMNFNFEKNPKIDFTIVESFDINETANSIYETNFGHATRQVSIEHLTVKQLNNYAANMWTMSPPCPPYTKQKSAKNRQSKDTRSTAFFHLLKLLETTKQPPQFILLENVRGFETSDSFDVCKQTLKRCNYEIQQFLLTPTQFEIPNQRVRYYLLAVHQPRKFIFSRNEDKVLTQIPSSISNSNLTENTNLNNNNNNTISDGKREENDENSLEILFDTNAKCHSLERYIDQKIDDYILKHDLLSEQTKQESTDKTEKSIENSKQEKENEEKVEKNESEDTTTTTTTSSLSFDEIVRQLIVPKQLIERYGKLFDIKDKSNTRSACFTKNYGRYVEGTGTFLKISNLKQTQTQTQTQSLRYMSPKEIANLMGFPNDFSMNNSDGTVSLRQQWAAIGNSVNVIVVGKLMKYMFEFTQ